MDPRKPKRHPLKTQVLIIGGGATGTALARDLALRGVQCTLVEKGDINSGASGSNHGLLHSGSRYVFSDQAAAIECRLENEILKKTAPHCIDDTGGLFVAVEGDDEKYAADFPSLCARCGIQVKALSVHEARELEPDLSERIFAAFEVKDAAIDPFRISLQNIAHAAELGVVSLQHTRVTGFQIRGRRIEAALLRDLKTHEEFTIEPDQVVAACGAWAADVAAMAGITIPIVYSKGTLLVAERRIARRVINRLRPATDGDILVPGGTVSILGTTSVRLETLDVVMPSVPEIDLLVREGSAMVPILESVRYIRAYSGVRPLLSTAGREDDRMETRGFTLLDHAVEGVENFLTIVGGKLTTFRLMAEKAADRVCERIGVLTPGSTTNQPLPDNGFCMWTDPGLGPKTWLKKGGDQNRVLCECEILPESIIDEVIGAIEDQHEVATLAAISLRSRMGKGPCQGTFCGLRVTAHLYEKEGFKKKEGLNGLKEFLQERWKGEHAVLWGGQIMQAEFKEAVYCATGCLDQDSGRKR
ncbi:MAG: FAD-dependent oxidoreductase [Desulfobacteraceae bacterium]|nr:MAG: FAD-dependent oxidoreductase [Desulfobacteraceae bacterium]